MTEQFNQKKFTIADPVILQLFPLIKYDDYNKALGFMNTIASFHKMCRIIGHPGSGKTTMLWEFVKNTPNAVLITPPLNCNVKDLIKMLGIAVDYYSPIYSKTDMINNLISFLNSRGRDTIFIIDEADNLCSREAKEVKNINKLEILRYIWDHTRSNVSFIFAAPYELEVRLQQSGDSITCSSFYRRCQFHKLSGITREASENLLTQVEKEFHVKFDPNARNKLTQRMIIPERGGLGTALQALEMCFMQALPKWNHYYRAIEQQIPREEALRIFDDSDIVRISEALVDNALELNR